MREMVFGAKNLAFGQYVKKGKFGLWKKEDWIGLNGFLL